METALSESGQDPVRGLGVLLDEVLSAETDSRRDGVVDLRAAVRVAMWGDCADPNRTVA